MIAKSITAVVLAVALMGGALPPISGGEFARRARPMLSMPMVQLMVMREPKQLMKQFAAAGERVRASQAADQAAGRKPESCLPPKGKARIDFNKFVTFLERLPTAEQARPLERALMLYFPCPG